jgi:hypothetical protein
MRPASARVRTSAVRRARTATLGAGCVALTLVLTACGGGGHSSADKTPSPTVPTPSVEVPPGVELTDPGTKLTFGEKATVPYQANERRGSVLELTVLGVTRARLADFAGYVLDDRTRASTPYYVHVKVANVGTGDAGGTDVPLWAVDQDDTLIHSSTFTNAFKRCPSTALPASFAPHATTTTCLVYLLPNHGTMTSASFRPLQAFAPIVWTGTVQTEPAPVKKPARQKKRATP